MDMRHEGFEKIVSLFGKAQPVKFPAIAQVDAYWEALREGRLMPDRSEVDPRGLGDALEYAFLLEQVAPGIGRVRISGKHLRDILGMEVRGMPLTAFFVPDARPRITRALESVVTNPQVADITLSSPAGISKPALQARLFMAPLSNAGTKSARILCCLESHGGIGRSPRRFSVDRVQMRRIVATAGASTPLQPAAPAPTQTPAPAAPKQSGFADPRPAFAHAAPTKAPLPEAPAASSKRAFPPYLRLVKND